MNEGKPPDDDAGRPTTRSLKDSDAGRVNFRQGNAVWEWNTRTGAFNLEETMMLVRRLDNPDLALEGPVSKRELQLRAQIAVQAQAQYDRSAAHGAKSSDPPVVQPASPSPSPAQAQESQSSSTASSANDWTLQTWAPTSAKPEGSNPYDTAAPAGRGPPAEERGRRTDWALRSGPNEVPKDARGFNPYGDDPPPRRKQ